MGLWADGSLAIAQGTSVCAPGSGLCHSAGGTAYGVGNFLAHLLVLNFLLPWEGMRFTSSGFFLATVQVPTAEQGLQIPVPLPLALVVNPP